MRSIPLLPDESPLVTQAFQRLASSLKRNVTKEVVREVMPTTSEWLPLDLLDPSFWVVVRKVEARLEGRLLRMRGCLDLASPNDNPTVNKPVLVLAQAYRPTTDMMFSLFDYAVLRLTAETGEFTYSAKVSQFSVSFDQVVIPL